MIQGWRSRVLQPAAWWVDRLRMPRKLLVMAAIFVIPALAIGTQWLELLHARIEQTRAEREGALVLAPLLQLEEALLLHRGETAMAMASHSREGRQLTALDARIDAAIAAVEQWRHNEGRRHAALDTEWQTIIDGWHSLQRRSLDEDPRVNFEAHNALVADVKDQLTAVADATQLTLDPELATATLKSFVTRDAPAALDRVGRLRGYAAAHLVKGRVPDAVTLNELATRRAEMQAAFTTLPQQLQRVFTANEQLAARLREPLQHALAQQQAFVQRLDEGLPARAATTIDSETIFAAGTAATTALADINRAALPELQRMLDERLHEAYRQRKLVLLACAAAALLATYFFLGSLASLNGALHRLREAAVRMTHNDFPERIEMASRDEMRDIARELETISQSCRRYNAAQREQLIDATKRGAALGNASVGFMIVDPTCTIESLNPAAIEMFRRARGELSARMAGFDPDTLIGHSFALFHSDPEQQRRTIAALRAPLRESLRIGSASFDLQLTPIFTPDGERLGAVIEWVDRTAQEAVERRISGLAAAAAAGDFSQRVALADLDGNYRVLAGSLNELIDVVEGGLREVARVLRAVAGGDLTQTMSRDFGGQFAELSQHTNETVATLADIVGRIKQSALSVHGAAGEIAAGNNDLAARTEQQAAQIEETASSMEELTSAVRLNTDSATQASELARKVRSMAGDGGAMVDKVVASMNAIEGSSRRVADIIGVIDGIAFQTNILALNAAVEAARAGEQGRGFAVVASEVRSLAQRAGGAAREIRQLIAASVDEIGQGAGLVAATGRTMSSVVDGIREVATLMDEISAASREQAGGIEQVNGAMMQMDETTQQNAALVEQASASAATLRDQAGMLADAVAVFRLAGAATAGGLAAPVRIAA